METAAANTKAARAFVAELARSGVADACVSPGSRSTPLALALAEQRAIRPWLHLDERSAAFFATGLVRATGRPVALVCTSGTAAANYLPAVAEANLARIPLVVCTTDRPPHLRGTGAPQTMTQVGLYSSHVKYAVDLPLPGRCDDEVRFAGYAAQAVEASVAGRPGPVHLNLPFDEPLLAPPAAHPAPATIEVVATAPARAAILPPEEAIADAASRLRKCRRPLVVAGPETGGLPRQAILSLAEHLGAPVLADPLSGLRSCRSAADGTVVAYDACLRAPAGGDLLPDAVIRFGAIPTSKALNGFLASAKDAFHLLCDLPGEHRDPDALASCFLGGDPAAVCAALLACGARTAAGDGWRERWLSTDRRAAQAMRAAALGFDEPFEGRVFLELGEALPGGATIFAGNSMPVRDMDSFFFGSEKPCRLEANRGVNGIDGVTSSAMGMAARAAGPTVLVTGDVSFYHDLNGLWAAARHDIDLVVVLVNNNGGGIFHYLPQAAHTAHFEEWWGTPPGLDFAHATRLFKGEHVVIESWEAFREALPAAPGHGLRVLELQTSRERNVAMHRQAWAAAAAAAFGPAGR